ncbi:toluene tolerance family protein [Defluviimonas sp. 20V17]|uniref:ABC transporter n=1 Tax=Allgaiera indica TaxID=765699 RepID=A0AAN4ZY55_9RHOB|nr:ABC transporter substrate-binding protein [Allgaiera indica]KDB04740.1 toluene tolerance family protein [Defluviimonas sp. 20V17]GHD99122.1 ABC transporter [Allgaiera indica]SDW00304.1 phospholipid transport system substrate-binding protein [Allgaiera indica]
MAIEPTRRSVIAGLMAGATTLALAGPVAALTTAEARDLVDTVVNDINRVINSGGSLDQMVGQFEHIFDKYADVDIIAQSSLGIAFRRATPAQRRAYIAAFRGYIARKYGKRFREFIGGKIEVTGARQIKSGIYEVSSLAKLRGEAPFDLKWLVSDKAGRNLFFNMIIDGVNMLATERQEIGAMLDRNGGNIDKLIAELKHSG